MRKIENLNELSSLLETFSIRGTISNNYLLLDSYQDFIFKKQLYFLITQANLFFLVKNNGFFRLYYHLNNIDEPFKFDCGKPVTMEIIYRGEKNKPLNVFKYWERSGFKEHIARENMAAVYHQITLPAKNNPSVLTKLAENENEIKFSKELFEKAFDPYTGDILSLEETARFALGRNLLVSYYKDGLCGALQFEIKNQVVWIGHIAISPEFRGKGIANELISAYITLNVDQSNTRYQLWVMQDNPSAIGLYKKFGFNFTDKTSASMLKK